MEYLGLQPCWDVWWGHAEKHPGVLLPRPSLGFLPMESSAGGRERSMCWQGAGMDAPGSRGVDMAVEGGGRLHPAVSREAFQVRLPYSLEV